MKSESLRSRREAEFFNSIGKKQTEAWWGHLTPAGARRDARRARLVVEAIALQPGQRALEIGCGGGSFASRYSHCLPPDTAVDAIDIAESLIQHAQQRTDIAPGVVMSFQVGNVERLQFPDCCFDAVFGSSILHHLELERAMPELIRVLRPGGRFCFAEPNMANPEVWLTRNVSWLRKRSQTSDEETAFYRWQIRRICQQNGLIAVRSRPFDFLHPSTPASIIPIVDSLGRCIESLPLLREISGSLLITAFKASPGA